MINVATKKELPKVCRLIREQEDGTFNVYFDDDQEIIDSDLRESKSGKYQEVDNALKYDIDSGFELSGGIYSLDSEDVTDLASMIELGRPSDYKQMDGNRGRFKPHTLNELKNIRGKGIEYKLAAYKRHEELIDSIDNAETIDQVLMINYE